MLPLCHLTKTPNRIRRYPTILNPIRRCPTILNPILNSIRNPMILNPIRRSTIRNPMNCHRPKIHRCPTSWNFHRCNRRIGSARRRAGNSP